MLCTNLRSKNPSLPTHSWSSSFRWNIFFRTIFLLIITWFIGFQNAETKAQELGLWIPSHHSNETEWTLNLPDSSLTFLDDLGIKTLILPLDVLSEGSTLSNLTDLWDGEIVIDYGIQFLDAYHLELEQDSLLNNYASGMILARQQPSITGHLVHRYSPIQDSLFNQVWGQVSQILKQFNPNTFFYVIPENLERLAPSENAEAMTSQWIYNRHIFDSPFQWEDLDRIEEAFSSDSTAEYIWFTQAWLNEAFITHPSLEESLIFWEETGDFMLAAPAEKMGTAVTHWSSPFMVALILLFLGIYQQSQVYRQTPVRYFTHYSFLVDDMLRYSERYAPTGFLLFVVRAGVVSLSCIIWGLSNGTDLDWRYLGHLLIGQPGESSNTFLIWSLLSFMLLVLQFVELLLLRIPKSGYRSLREIFTIYSWNVHLNLFVLVLTFIAFVNEFTIINGMIIIYLIGLSWFIGFVISAIQGVKTTNRGGKRYLFWCCGSYLLLISLGLYLFNQSDAIYGIMSMFEAL